jgi:hypothetical protein
MSAQRTILAVSIAANVVLLAVAVALGWHRPKPSDDRGTPVTAAAPENVSTEATLRASEQEEAGFEVKPPVPSLFHWSQVESEDYREYMANLRAMGCPEPLIRDMILAELQEAFRKRHGGIQRKPVPPWAGRDRRQAVQQEYLRHIHALEEEQRAVTVELLGFAWCKEVRNEFLADAEWGILLGHLADEQAVQTMDLLRLYQDRAAWIRFRAQNILLEEDWEELAALDRELKGRLATILTPAEWEETLMRTYWGEGLWGQGHFELAGLTGAELRRLTQLYTRRVDGIAETLIMARVVTEAERVDRQRELEADWLEAFGPVKAAALKWAKDDRFQDLHEFTQQRGLPLETAVSVHEIRLAAEEEIQRLRANSTVDASASVEPIDDIQTATMEALTRLLGPAHISEYVARAGAWLDLGETETDGGKEVAP